MVAAKEVAKKKKLTEWDLHKKNNSCLACENGRTLYGIVHDSTLNYFSLLFFSVEEDEEEKGLLLSVHIKQSWGGKRTITWMLDIEQVKE